MKKSMFFKSVLLVLFMLASLPNFAQDKVDTVNMLNGEKREGKVLSIGDSMVKFAYKGESLEYEFKKSEVNSIKFASGRTEIITKAPQGTVSAADRKGKIAVLPFEYITNESNSDVQAMGRQLQSDTYNSLRENTSLPNFQDPVTTNSLLAEEGLSPEAARLKRPADLATLLGVEYVVYGIATVTNKGSSTFSSGSTTYNGKETQKTDRNKETTKTSGTVYGSGNAATMVNYNTKIDLKFYDDAGVNRYAQSRESFGSDIDAYHATINYLIKRCPFGSKAKK
ncbi:hypothetical protein FNO01nite_26440 [Flavobacterium noncentrifugens]|uniref:Uncharacterized protein n=1 Tax=Flavobacterium noncentrifugens TaxID=1128970 RepID=A0A1G8ZE94_9FLAO|nr:hypothetical protein [Flavobacterium noncentrifugens]GEP51972.1 hypothetical protein FNO01nite_26440 [Flavobacterium noncentrifugens]SDK13446.1 hypothetical protein SAMN04487935_2555 [Flavobacterium noncentrifugens]